MWCFLVYVAVYALNGFFIPEQTMGEWLTRLMTLVQLIILFWLASSLFEQEKMAKSVLLSWAIVSCISAAGILFGVPGFSDSAQGVAESTREAGMGSNVNNLAPMMAMAVVTLIGLFLSWPITNIRLLLLVFMVLPPCMVMVRTGSRGGVVVFMIGCLVYLVPFLQRNRRLRAIVLGALGIAAVSYMIATNSYFMERWRDAYYEGDFSSREEIFPMAMEMIVERPVFGWQPAEFIYELGRRLGVPSGRREAHNLFLHVLLEVGLVGAIPFFAGLSLCAWTAWKARAGNLGLLPFALVLSIFVTNMSITWIDRKMMWLILALSVAAWSSAAKNHGKRSVFALEGKSVRLVDRARVSSHSAAEYQNHSRE
jgi:O-antigen ligase